MNVLLVVDTQKYNLDYEEIAHALSIPSSAIDKEYGFIKYDDYLYSFRVFNGHINMDAEIDVSGFQGPYPDDTPNIID